MKRKLAGSLKKRSPVKKKAKTIDSSLKQPKLEFFFNNQLKRQNETKFPEEGIIHETETTREENSALEATRDDTQLEETKLNTTPSSQSRENIDFETILSKDIVKFDPSKIEWSTPTLYSFLCSTFSLVDKTKSRIKILDYITNMLRVLIYHDSASVLPAVWLSSNEITPSYEGVELGIGSHVLSKAVTSVSGCSHKALKAFYDKYGDWGDVAYEAKVSVRTLFEPRPLDIRTVYKNLLGISKLKGNGMVDQKTDLVKKLLISCKGEEVRYLTRTLIRNLRVGAVGKSVLISLARAFCLTSPKGIDRIANSQYSVDFTNDSKETINTKLKAAESLLKECFAQYPNYDGIVNTLLSHPIDKLMELCHLTVGVPLRPMLGQITRDFDSLFKKLQGRPCNCEMKYDGQRVQIHYNSNSSSNRQVSVFSRHLENITEKYPDIVDIIPKTRKDSITSFILDAEVVAVGENGKIENFQKLSNRSRKNVTLSLITIPICIFAFDLMYLNEEPLLKKSLRERRDLLETRFNQIPNKFAFVKHIESSSEEEIHEFFRESIEAGCEGIMVKVLDEPPRSLDIKTRMNFLASYEPDKRLESWIKLKKDYIEGLGDSLDVVPIGAWHGNGRKVNWWSPILLAVYNPETEMFESLCKCMSGFSDEFYKEMKQRYSHENGNLLETKKWYYDVDEGLRPEVWFEPQEVWEIRGADITISPVYKAACGKVDRDKGVSLRFPRFLRVREDKKIEDTTTSQQLVEMYYKQTKEHNVAEDDELDEVLEEIEDDEVDYDEEADTINSLIVGTG
ncbi:8042_t:CDS:10 [Ambispora gerdemannii]|uniref:DNA ligase n=1 Tax=Ambispora gerdemannii TaxID=144530 RepID=A0A9N8VDQ1_9GLOM|nr:8042_t:CDS:10 [Ambispora gerdemannii]